MSYRDVAEKAENSPDVLGGIVRKIEVQLVMMPFFRGLDLAIIVETITQSSICIPCKGYKSCGYAVNNIKLVEVHVKRLAILGTFKLLLKGFKLKHASSRPFNWKSSKVWKISMFLIQLAIVCLDSL